MQSIPGRFFKSVALTMAFAIMVSLLVSFTLTPMLSARLLKRLKRKSEEEPPSGGVHEVEKASWVMRFLDHWYTRILTFSLDHRWIVVVTAILVVISTAPIAKYVGFNFFPQDDQDEFEVSLRAPEGTSLQKTLEITQQVAAGIRGLRHIGYTLTTVGEDQQRTQNLANIYVKLTPLADRPISQFDIMGQVRDQVLPKFDSYDLRAVVSPVAAISGGGGRFNADISFMLRGPNLEKLDQYSQHLLSKLKAMPGVVDADSSLIVGKPELRAAIDRQKASDLGVSIADIAQSLRLLVGGDQVSTYNEGGEQYEVHVRANEGFRIDPAGISKLNVPSQRLGSVGLDNVVTLREAAGPTQIERNGRQRQVTFTANLKPGFSQSDTLARLTAEVKAMNLPPEYVSGVAGNSKELQRTGRGFIIAFMLSFIFMYIVLAAQFESFIHPVTVLLALPLSLPFALISLLITGQAFNMFTMLGLLVLFGMVKKNSILQIDHANGLRAKGMERHVALIQSSRDRLRPILMTTIAFVAGMAPLAWSNGPGAGVNRSTSVVVIGGQTLCLLLTLLVTPVAYSIFDDWVNSPLWGRIAARWEGLTGRLRQKVATATSSFLGLFGK
jgi:HAE1 family hydrophobic/amphiphilic exporter-1